MGRSSVDISAKNENSPLLNGKSISSISDSSERDEKGKVSATRLLLVIFLVALLVFLFLIVMMTTNNRQQQGSTPATLTSLSSSKKQVVRVAFMGNSMFYFNDFPRFFQAIADDDNLVVEQNSCLHGGSSIPSLILEGNSMFPQFGTPQAILPDATREFNNHTVYDYGACTVPQLLYGVDPRLDDPGYANPENKTSTNKNPCREDPIYLDYAKKYFQQEIAEYHDDTPTIRNTKKHHHDKPYWNFALINDNTRNPSREKTRAHSLQFLESFYLPWFQESHVTPVFLWTHAYSISSTAERNMNGLEDVANFTSLTGVGYRAYQELLQQHLPSNQKPRIAPVGLAFLLVYEENYELWKQLFHSDHIHASPLGTFLQGCVIYHTLFGKLPNYEQVVLDDMPSLWKTARMMQHAWEPPNPFPTKENADYLYQIAKRIMVDGDLPKTYIPYQNGEFAYEKEQKEERKSEQN